MTMKSIGKAQESPMDKKRLDYYKKKLQSRREELMRTIARTEEEGRQADDDQTVDLADKAAKLEQGQKPNPFIDTPAYRNFIDHAEREFRERLRREQKQLGG